MLNKLSLNEIADNVENVDEIWYAKDKSSISYPDEGNNFCFNIEDNSFWFKHRNKIILSLIDKFPPNGYIFDIGGGNGYVSKYLLENGYDIFLVEPGKGGIQNAKMRGLSNLLCATVSDAKFKPNSIASVGLFDVIEHMNDDKAFLQDINKILISSGFIYITVPSYNWLWSKEDEIAGHYRRYTLKSMSKILRDAGFDLIFKSYFFTLLPFPIFIFRTIPSFLNYSKKLVNKNEHIIKKGNFITKLINYYLNWELHRISKLKFIPFGGSCILIARKNN